MHTSNKGHFCRIKLEFQVSWKYWNRAPDCISFHVKDNFWPTPISLLSAIQCHFQCIKSQGISSPPQWPSDFKWQKIKWPAWPTAARQCSMATTLPGTLIGVKIEILQTVGQCFPLEWAATEPAAVCRGRSPFRRFITSINLQVTYWCNQPLTVEWVFIRCLPQKLNEKFAHELSPTKMKLTTRQMLHVLMCWTDLSLNCQYHCLFIQVRIKALIPSWGSSSRTTERFQERLLRETRSKLWVPQNGDWKSRDIFLEWAIADRTLGDNSVSSIAALYQVSSDAHKLSNVNFWMAVT